MRMRVRSLALLSGLRIQRCGVGRRHGLDPELLWLWCRLATVALIRPLAWELPYAPGVPLAPQKECHMYKTIVIFWDWLLSCSIILWDSSNLLYVSAVHSFLFLSSVLFTLCLFIYPLNDIWIVSSSGRLWTEKMTLTTLMTWNLARSQIGTWTHGFLN